MIKSICYFGNFDPEYARNRVIIKGLRENGVQVHLCRTQEKNIYRKYKDLKKQLQGIPEYDILVVGYSDSRSLVPIAKILSSKKVIWDAFYSIYDAWVWDRKLIKPLSAKAVFYWLADRASCILADAVLLDTNTQIEYFIKTFILKRRKFIRVLIGADNSIFHPL